MRSIVFKTLALSAASVLAIPSPNPANPHHHHHHVSRRNILAALSVPDLAAGAIKAASAALGICHRADPDAIAAFGAILADEIAAANAAGTTFPPTKWDGTTWHDGSVVDANIVHELDAFLLSGFTFPTTPDVETASGVVGGASVPPPPAHDEHNVPEVALPSTPPVGETSIPAAPPAVDAPTAPSSETPSTPSADAPSTPAAEAASAPAVDTPSQNTPSCDAPSAPSIDARSRDATLANVVIAPEAEVGKRRLAARHVVADVIPTSIPLVIVGATGKVAEISQKLVATISIQANIDIDITIVVTLVQEIYAVLEYVLILVQAIVADPTGEIWALGGKILSIHEVACLLVILVKNILIVLGLVVTTVSVAHVAIIAPIVKAIIEILVNILILVFTVEASLQIVVFGLIGDVHALLVCLGVEGIWGQFGIAY